MPAPRNYIICATQRSGSTLLAESLRHTHLAGDPREWLDDNEVQENCTAWGINPEGDGFADYLDELTKRTTLNGIFGIKILYTNLGYFRNKLFNTRKYSHMAWDDVLELLFPNPRYIRIIRRDLISQAISYYRATLTDEWWRIKDLDHPRMEVTDAHYDQAEIERHLRIIINSERLWDEFFIRKNIEPLTIVYEDFEKDIPATIDKVMHYLGIDYDINILPPPRLMRQSDELNELWSNRYKEYLRERSKG